ncbi:hypothetical protein [Paludibacterium yongneupense]|uniref:hypothetical protein n=1 Tax=Paludibacterium yongneupense TaxID=400061 RepID=UPI0012EBE114|nr:hypothetical protein [Paludibacterium yongneupense]
MRIIYIFIITLFALLINTANAEQTIGITAPVIKNGLTCRYDVTDGFSGVKLRERVDTFQYNANGTMHYKRDSTNFVYDMNLNQIVRNGEIHEYYHWPFTPGEAWDIKLNTSDRSSFTATISSVGIEIINGVRSAHTHWSWHRDGGDYRRDFWLNLDTGCEVKETYYAEGNKNRIYNITLPATL